MNYHLLIFFIALNIANVIIQTVKSLCTINCGKSVAALVNALAYGLYTVVLVYTVCDLPLFLKAGVVALCNLIGVFVVKWIEEKLRKDRLWKIEMTVPEYQEGKVIDALSNQEIPFNYIKGIGKYTIVNVYASSKEQTAFVNALAANVGAKRFASETKLA